MFLSAKADFASLAVVFVAIPLLTQTFLNAPLNSVPLSDQTFCGCTFSILLSNALAASGALFDCIGTTRKNLDNTSTATSTTGFKVFSKYLKVIVLFCHLDYIGDIY